MPNFAAKNVISSSGENWPTPSARAFTRAAIVDTLTAAAHMARLLGVRTIHELPGPRKLSVLASLLEGHNVNTLTAATYRGTSTHDEIRHDLVFYN